jgi:hypothetical protein
VLRFRPDIIGSLTLDGGSGSFPDQIITGSVTEVTGRVTIRNIVAASVLFTSLVVIRGDLIITNVHTLNTFAMHSLQLVTGAVVITDSSRPPGFAQVVAIGTNDPLYTYGYTHIYDVTIKPYSTANLTSFAHLQYFAVPFLNRVKSLHELGIVKSLMVRHDEDNRPVYDMLLQASSAEEADELILGSPTFPAVVSVRPLVTFGDRATWAFLPL